MAKQSGVHKLRGKIGGLSYYESRNGGSLVRDINDGMSSRVKTAPEFANTRLNATEFGGAGKLAGAIIRPISQRWRYILSAIGTGTMAAAIKQAMTTDTANPWGERTIPLTAMDGLQEVYNSLSKNDLPQELVSFLDRTTYDSSNNKIALGGVDSATMDEDFVNTMLSLGAEGVITRVFQFNVGNLIYQPSSGKYTRSFGQDILWPLQLTEDELAVGNDLLTSINAEPYKNLLTGRVLVPQNAASHFGGVLIIMMPYKVVSNQKYILQELCAAKWVNIPDAE